MRVSYGGYTEDFVFDPDGELRAYTRSRSSGSGMSSTEQLALSYTQFGQVAEIRGVGVPPVKITYPPQGGPPVRIATPFAEAAYRYDPGGRLEQVAAPDGTDVTVKYDEATGEPTRFGFEKFRRRIPGANHSKPRLDGGPTENQPG